MGGAVVGENSRQGAPLVGHEKGGSSCSVTLIVANIRVTREAIIGSRHAYFTLVTQPYKRRRTFASGESPNTTALLPFGSIESHANSEKGGPSPPPFSATVNFPSAQALTNLLQAAVSEGVSHADIRAAIQGGFKKETLKPPEEGQNLTLSGR